MGSWPGLAGLSGMQVQPLLPCRRVRALLLASMTMMVAPSATDFGAADIALAIMS